jgi:aspartyl-tRNA(Asn)/glutamyl-tRNA(Gln) amidotransferase subunit A
LSDDLAFASITELGTRIRRREISSEEIVKVSIRRTQKLDPKLNSYITFLPEKALEQARAADQAMRHGEDFGPLHGIPISIKDHIATQGVRTTAGARFMLNNVPQHDAAVARRLKKAGAVLMGKANMNKFAGGESGDNPDFGKIKTPWNLNFSAGGSSGGSGAMVAAGLVPFSVGTDNGGSIRIPAAVCGIVGLKPTFGRVGIDGIFPRAYTFDHAGPLTRSVEDCAIALQVLAGHDPGNETTIRKPVPDYLKALTASTTPLRVGVDRKFAAFGEPAVLDRFEKALQMLEKLGASIREVTIPTAEEWLAVGNALSPEFSVSLGDIWRQRPGEIPPDDVPWLVAGELVPAVDYIRATQQRRLLQKQYAVATKAVDILACPSYPFERRPFGPWPAVGGRATTFDDALRYTTPFDVLGLPAISIPCGFSDDGFPIGLQFVGRAFDEPTVFRAAHTYEQATSWHTRRPAFSS